MLLSTINNIIEIVVWRGEIIFVVIIIGIVGPIYQLRKIFEVIVVLRIKIEDFIIFPVIYMVQKLSTSDGSTRIPVLTT